jgi:hypothetical protein
VQIGLEPGSRGIATVRIRYNATTSEDIAGCKNLARAVVIFKAWKSEIAL